MDFGDLLREAILGGAGIIIDEEQLREAREGKDRYSSAKKTVLNSGRADLQNAIDSILEKYYRISSSVEGGKITTSINF